MNALKPVIIFGAGALGQSVLETYKAQQIVVYGFLDDEPSRAGTLIAEVPILSHTDDEGYLKLIGAKCDACLAVEEVALRRSLSTMLEERRRVAPANAVHPSAQVASSAQLGYGVIIGAGAAIGAGVVIEGQVVIGSGAIIEPNCHLGAFSTVSAGARLGAGATLDEGAFVGLGAIVVGGIKVGKSANVGAGSVVVGTVAARSRVFGVPAAKV